MAFQAPYPYGGYQSYYSQPVPDQLAQLRQNQIQQQPTLQGAPPQMQQPVPPTQADNGGIIWVQGEAGAKAYLVAPGNTVQLWDSENPVIYLKSADMSGMPSMRILDYTERDTAQSAQRQKVPQLDLSQYITRDQLEEILAERFKQSAKPAKTKEAEES